MRRFRVQGEKKGLQEGEVRPQPFFEKAFELRCPGLLLHTALKGTMYGRLVHWREAFS